MIRQRLMISMQRGQELLSAVQLPGESNQRYPLGHHDDRYVFARRLTSEVTRMMNEAISHYLKGNYTSLAIAVR